MADNITTTASGTGALPVNTTVATRDTGTSHWQQVDVAPAPRTPVFTRGYVTATGLHTVGIETSQTVGP